MGASCPSEGEVYLWYADADRLLDDPARRERACTWLDPVERERYDRYRFDHDRAMFLLGRVMARALVGRALDIAPTAWRWGAGQFGRPHVADHPEPVSFNLAHSGGTVVCVVGRDSDVGVDVEDRAKRRVDERTVRRFCSPAEIADIEAQGPDGWRERFLKYWTLKEAYLKARGLGISVHLSHVGFQIGEAGITLDFLQSTDAADRQWAFELTTIGDDLLVALAASQPADARPRFVLEPMPTELLP